MKISTKSAFLIFHRWSGIIAGLLVVLIGITGSLLIFEDELDIAFNVGLYTVVPAGERRPLDQIITSAEEQDTNGQAFFVSRIDDSAERAFVVTLLQQNGDEKQVFVDPYTALVTGERSSLSSMALIRRLHGDLTLGAVGENTLGILALLLMAMLLAGLLVWLPRGGNLRKALSVRWDGGSRYLLRDLHNTGGVYLFFFLFLSALTVPPIVWKMTTPTTGPPARSTAQPPGASSAPPILSDSPVLTETESPPTTIPWQQAADAALAAVPNTWLGFILRPVGPQPFYLIRVFPPSVNTVSEQTTVFVNRYNGSIIRVSAPAAPTLTSLLSADFAASLHSGAIAGLPGRIIMFLAGLFFPVLFVTGFILWWRK
ncbi:MAG: PepSY-associated TM helix domain-containing protein [Rhodospirillaceae bacterium]